MFSHFFLKNRLLTIRPVIDKEESFNDEYYKVYSLESHLDDLDPEDLFQYTVTAVLLGKLFLYSIYIFTNQKS